MGSRVRSPPHMRVIICAEPDEAGDHGKDREALKSPEVRPFLWGFDIRLCVCVCVRATHISEEEPVTHRAHGLVGQRLSDLPSDPEILLLGISPKGGIGKVPKTGP